MLQQPCALYPESLPEGDLVSQARLFRMLMRVVKYPQHARGTWSPERQGAMIERMSALDVGFLYAETAREIANLSALFALDPSTHPEGRVSLESLTALIASRIHLVPRLRQKVTLVPGGAGRPLWVDDEAFHLRSHLREITLAPPGSQRGLAEVVERAQVTPLDRRRPLWLMHLIQGVEGGQTALLFTWHHAMADGMSSMATVRKVFQLAPGATLQAPEAWTPVPPPKPWELVSNAVAEQMAQPLEAVLKLASLDSAVLRERVSEIYEGVASLQAAGLSVPAPFRVPIGPKRRFAAANIPVQQAREVRIALGTTLNNLVLSLAAGALSRWLSSRDWNTPSLRALVPVSARRSASQTSQGNHISHFFVDLPVTPMDEGLRLRLVSEAAARARSSHQDAAQTAIWDLWNWVPTGLHAAAANALHGQGGYADVVITHAPGSPVEPFHIAGARYLAGYPVLPLGNAVTVGFGVASMAGVMGFGVIADGDAIGDARDLAEGVLAAFWELRREARVAAASSSRTG